MKKIFKYLIMLFVFTFSFVACGGNNTSSSNPVNTSSSSEVVKEKHTVQFYVEDELYIETKRADELREQIITVQDELAEIEYRGKKLADELNKIDEEIIKCNKSVSGKNDALTKKQEEQNKYQFIFHVFRPLCMRYGKAKTSRAYTSL